MLLRSSEKNLAQATSSQPCASAARFRAAEKKRVVVNVCAGQSGRGGPSLGEPPAPALCSRANCSRAPPHWPTHARVSARQNCCALVLPSRGGCASYLLRRRQAAVPLPQHKNFRKPYLLVSAPPPPMAPSEPALASVMGSRPSLERTAASGAPWRTPNPDPGTSP